MENPKITIHGRLIQVGSDGWNSSTPYAEIAEVALDKHSFSERKTSARIPLTTEQAQELAKHLFQEIVITVQPASSHPAQNP